MFSKEKIKKVYHFTQRYFNIFLGKEIFYKKQHRCPVEKHGSDYGGWHICPDKIDPKSIIYSFGVGEDITFDISLIEKYGVTIHAFDPTPKSIEWIKSQKLPKQFKMYNYGIAGYDGTVKFFPPENPDYVSHTSSPNPKSSGEAIEVNVHKLTTIMKMLDHDRIDILKMDIEGAEYEVISDIVKSNIDISQILVEFHHRFNYADVSQTKEAVEFLNHNGFKIFHISHTGEEYSFIKR